MCGPGTAVPLFPISSCEVRSVWRFPPLRPNLALPTLTGHQTVTDWRLEDRLCVELCDLEQFTLCCWASFPSPGKEDSQAPLVGCQNWAGTVTVRYLSFGSIGWTRVTCALTIPAISLKSKSLRNDRTPRCPWYDI